MPIAKPNPKPSLTPFWETTDKETVRLYNGDVLSVLRNLPAGSVHTVVTSPPYWGLRSYLDEKHENKSAELGSEKTPDCGQVLLTSETYDGEPLYVRGNCAERNWENGCHVCRMVLVFREVRRVLRDDGTLWLNYGDSYGQGSNLVGIPWRVALALQADGWILRQDIIWAKPSPMPESVKNRCTKAHEYVFLFAKKSGYFYDAEAIKDKSIDKESLEGRRPRKSRKDHTEAGQQAVKTSFDGERSGFLKGRANDEGRTYSNRNKRSVWKINEEEFQQFLEWKAANSGNKLDTWNISSEAYPGAHFATFPTKLITPMIKAGTSEKGCCPKCFAPYRRVIEETPLTRERPNDYVKRVPPGLSGPKGKGRIESGIHQGGVNSSTLGKTNTCANSVAGVDTKTVGWEPTCECFGKFEKRKVVKKIAQVGERSNTSWAVGQESHDVKDYQTEDGRKRERKNGEQYETFERVYIPSSEPSPVPCTVLDIFIGSGTSCAVAFALGRNSIGIDLSEEYLRNNAVPRIEGEILSRPSAVRLLPGREREELYFGEEIS